MKGLPTRHGLDDETMRFGLSMKRTRQLSNKMRSIESMYAICYFQPEDI